MKSVLARFQSADVGDHLHIIARFRERDGARNLTAGLRLEFRRRFGCILPVRNQSESARRAYGNNYCFHAFNVPLGPLK